jgi:hypothetical protein
MSPSLRNTFTLIAILAGSVQPAAARLVVVLHNAVRNAGHC